MTKSHLLPIFKCQYLVEILRYGSNFLHVIITFIGFKITFSNIRSHGAPLLISRGWRLAPPPGLLTLRNTLALKGLKYLKGFYGILGEFKGYRGIIGDSKGFKDFLRISMDVQGFSGIFTDFEGF